ncbi:hypothetical protein BC835DRAFT_1331039 [Cytidiella melzeri]|nr:hypothetical protein BC835DRAFT_1331039 [Cytidiella melzeri]
MHPPPPYMTPPLDECYVEKLPDEIILDIIVSATEPYKRDSYNNTSRRGHSVSRLAFQEVLSHVCGRWRALALGMPSLWRHFDFLEGPPFDRSREWLRRSKDTPIDVVINCTKVWVAENERILPLCYSLGKIDPPDVGQIRDLILPHVSRWKSFTFYADHPREWRPTLIALVNAGAAPKLESLFVSLALDWDLPADSYAGYVPFSGQAPQLRRLELETGNIDWERCTFLLGSGLERLSLHYHAENSRPSFPNFVRVLQSSCNLHTLELRHSGPSGNEESWPWDMVELPSVTRLVVGRMEASYLTGLMRRLIFPKLEELEIECIMDECTFLVDVLCDVVPLHSLVGLHIRGVITTDECTVERFWMAVQNLETLHISEVAPQFEDVFYEILKRPNSFPRLHTFNTCIFDAVSLARPRKGRNP